MVFTNLTKFSFSLFHLCEDVYGYERTSYSKMPGPELLYPKFCRSEVCMSEYCPVFKRENLVFDKLFVLSSTMLHLGSVFDIILLFKRDL